MWCGEPGRNIEEWYNKKHIKKYQGYTKADFIGVLKAKIEETETCMDKLKTEPK